MRALLDVNVLIALFDTQNVAYELAHGWLSTNLKDGWASCPLTENGCLRGLTNPRYANPLTSLVANLHPPGTPFRSPVASCHV